VSVAEARVGEVYLYGLVDAAVGPPEGVRGVADADVAVLPLDGGVAALISSVEPEDVGTADDLLAHAAVLDAVARRATVVPLVFGTFVDPADDTTADLAAAYRRLAPALEGAVQLTLTARYVQEAVLAELVGEVPDIAALRRSGSARDASRAELLALGELVVEGLETKAEGDAAAIERALVPAARDVVVRDRRSADDVLELAALVDRDATDRFVGLAERIAEEQAGRMRIRLLGPQAPYDFVDEA
jgi:hypothetical protein